MQLDNFMIQRIEKIIGTKIVDLITVIGVKELEFAGEFVRFVRGCDEMEICSQKLNTWWD